MHVSVVLLNMLKFEDAKHFIISFQFKEDLACCYNVFTLDSCQSVILVMLVVLSSNREDKFRSTNEKKNSLQPTFHQILNFYTIKTAPLACTIFFLVFYRSKWFWFTIWHSRDIPPQTTLIYLQYCHGLVPTDYDKCHKTWQDVT